MNLAGQSWDETLDAGESIRFIDGADPRVDYDGTNLNGAHLDMVFFSPGGVTIEVAIGAGLATGAYTVRELPEPAISLMLLIGVGALIALRSRTAWDPLSHGLTAPRGTWGSARHAARGSATRRFRRRRDTRPRRIGR